MKNESIPYIQLQMSDDENDPILDIEEEVEIETEEEDDDIEDLDDQDDENIEEEEEEDSEEEDEDDIEVDIEEIEEIDDGEEDVLDTKEDIDDSDIGNFLELEDKAVVVSQKKRRRVMIQRYCKSIKELVPRTEFINKSYTVPVIQTILEHYTTTNNAIKFSSCCQSMEKNDLYQLCGKLIKKDYSNAQLFEEVKNKTSHWKSDTFKKERNREVQDIAIMTIKLDVTEGLYECGRCKSKKTFSRQVQTRSADEGMTSIIQCSDCNKVWREYA